MNCNIALARRTAASIIIGGFAMAAAPLPAAAPLVGVWGGDRATLTITAGGGSFIEDCATATFAGPVFVDANGKFTAAGARFAEGFGPTRIDESGPARPNAASFEGRVTGAAITLEVRVGGGAPMRYNLRAGPGPKRIACM